MAGRLVMRREQLTEKLLDIKRARGWSWKCITGEIGGMSPVLVVGALSGNLSSRSSLKKTRSSDRSPLDGPADIRRPSHVR